MTEELHNEAHISFEKITSDSVINRIRFNQNIRFITAKGHMTYSDADVSLDGGITLYVIKDSLYLAIIKKLGFELSRILITKDSFKILDRINQSYSVYAIDKMMDSYKIPVDFSSIHQVLTSGCFLDSEIFYDLIKNKRQCTLLGVSEHQTLTYQLDSFHLLPHAFEARNEEHTLHVSIQKSKHIAGKLIPVEFNLNVSNTQSQIMNLQLVWDDIKLDAISAIKFIVPDHYTKDIE